MSKCNCNESQISANALLSNPDALREDLAVYENGSMAFDENTTHALVSICVNATASNGRICFNFPLVGNVCFNPPVTIPNGTVQVCASTCGFRIGVPPFKGIKANVIVNGNTLWSGTIWGSC